MRAQSVRKTIGILNALLLLGVGGAVAWYVLEVKPALASGAKPREWLEKAQKQYDEDKRNLRSADVFPLKDGELDVIKRPDLVKEAGVWSYVGPVPVPLPKKEETAGTEPPPPEGIDALGKPHSVIVHPGERPSMVQWKFNSNKMGYFSEGEFIKEAKTDKDRFKLIDVRMPNPNSLSLVYEVYDDPKKAPVETKTGGPYDLSRKFDPHKLVREPIVAKAAETKPGEAPGPGPAPGPGVEPVPPTPPVPVRVEDLRPTVRRTGNRIDVEFDDATYQGFKNVTVEDVISKVRTEDVVDTKTGQKVGVRISDTGGVANGFDVQRGDILKRIQGTPVHSRDEAVKVVKALPKDTTLVTVVIERNGADLTYNVDPRDPKVRAAAGKVRYEGR
jgi:hypothetical protein